MFRSSSIRARLLASLLVVALVASAGLSLYFLQELEAFALRKLEERLGAQARVAAALLGSVYEETGGSPGTLDPLEPVVLTRALQQVSPEIASRMRIADGEGRIVADSAGRKSSGDDYSGRPEIATALAGQYGATTRVTPGSRVALYVAVPIQSRGSVVGVSYASATTFSILTLLRDYRERLALLVMAFAAAMLLLTEAFSRWLAAPLRELAAGATELAAGNHAVRVTPRGSRETRELAMAFNHLASEVDSVVTELKAEERRKSRFVSDVSHELRTPLTAIRGAAETLLDAEVDPANAQRFLSTIVTESDRLARLANDLLTLQRIEGATGELPLRRLPLQEIAARAVGALAPVLDARDVQVEIAGEGGVVLGDPDRLQQVIANLVDNASRVSPEGSAVRLELGRDERWVTLDIVDAGPGIADEDLPHLFERFYRAQASRDRSTGGAGLGLAIVKAIVDAHAGQVEAGNAPDGGGRFTLRLPALEPEMRAEY